MGHKESPETQKLQKQNWASFMAWVQGKGSCVMPIPNRAVIYAGFPESDLRKVRAFLMSEEDLKGMWNLIDQVNRNIVEVTGQVQFDKLSDVLKRIRSPLPKVVYTHGNLAGAEKRNFQSMAQAVDFLTSRDSRALDRGMHNSVWQELSALYVRNANDVTIWEGKKKNYKQVNVGQVMINRELKELLVKKSLPVETLKKVVAIAKRHQEFFVRQSADGEKILKQAEARLKKAASS